MADKKYTRSQLQRALERAQLNPEENAQHIVNITRMLENGDYKIESWERDDGAFKFDNLNDNEEYNKALNEFYGRYTKNPEVDKPLGQRKKGFSNISEDFGQMSTLSNWQDLKYDADGNLKMSNEELKEKSFELFNSALWNEVNLARFGNEISKMSTKERENLAVLYDIYEQTAAFGEGSRSGFEQFKDAGHLLYAPSTWIGGRLITAPIMKTTFRAAMKKMLKGGARTLTDSEKEILKAGTKAYANRSGMAGAGFTGGYDALHQTQLEMKLDPEQEYDAGRTAKMTGLGYGLGWALSKAPKYAGKTLRAPGALLNQLAPNTMRMARHPLQTSGGAFMKSFGGKKAARFHVGIEGEKDFGLKADDLDVTGHGSKVKEDLTQASKEAFNNFKNDFKGLGDLGVSEKSIFSIIRQIEEHIPGFKGLSNISRKLEMGTLSPTEALRKIRSKLGLMVKNTKNPNNPFYDFQDDFIDLSKAVREHMKQAASNSGKLKPFLDIDKRYSEFIKTYNKDEFSNLITEDSSKTIEKLRSYVSANNMAKLDEHLKRVEIVAKHSGDDTILETNRAALRGILGEKLFKGEGGSGFNTYLSTRQGRDVLKNLWKGKEQTIDNLAKIRQNSQDKGDMGMFAMRIFTTVIGGAFTVSGQFGSALITGGAFLGMEALIRTPWFRRAAAKAFSRDTAKSLAARLNMAETLKQKGYSIQNVNKIMNTVLGSAGWAWILSDENRRQGIKKSPETVRNSFIGKLLIDNNITKRTLGGLAEFPDKAVGFGTKQLKKFQPTFDTVTDLLISE